MSYTAFIGTNAVRNSKGIYTLAVSDEGNAQISSTCAARNAGFLAISPDRKYLYATRENMVFHGKACGGIAAYRVGNGGRLTYLNEEPVAGQLPCYCATDKEKRYVFVSSYLNGCISIHKILSDGQIGPVWKVLQHESRFDIHPSMHCVQITPDGQYVVGIDVTQHRITFYDLAHDTFDVVFDLQLPGPYNTCRTRQIAFSASHAYVILETGHGLITFRYQPDDPEHLLVREDTFELLPDGFTGRASGAGVRLSPNGQMLVCSVRRADLITWFQVHPDGTLSDQKHTPSHGAIPRDLGFTPDGRYLLVAAQRSDAVEIFRTDYQQNQLEFVSECQKIPDGTCVIVP